MAEGRDPVPDDQRQVIQVELRLSGVTPAGVATGPDGASRTFFGWMGLMSAVDALTADDPVDDDGH